ncbi:MAG: hypothetical protein IKY44_04715, partial [Clostridia bacterium]|nr:hypothetical protein [Clostridia bacterium]
MTKKILGVLLVICTLLTMVQFIGSASNVDENGVLVIDSTASASGDGWNWDGATLTLAQGEVKAIVFEKISSAKLVLTENVTLDASGVIRGAALDADAVALDIDTGDYVLKIRNSTSGAGMNVHSSTIKGVIDVKVAAGGTGVNLRGTCTIEDALLISNAQISGTNLTIKNSKVVVDNSAAESGHGIYAEKLVISSSIVDAKSSEDTDISAAIAGYSVYIENSNVTVDGAVFGINVYDSAIDKPVGDAKLTISNSTLNAKGGVAALSDAYSYSQYRVNGNSLTGKKDTGLLSWTNVTFTTPTSTTKKICSAKDSSGSTFYFVSIAASSSWLSATAVKEVITTAKNTSLLPSEDKFNVVIPEDDATNGSGVETIVVSGEGSAPELAATYTYVATSTSNKTSTDSSKWTKVSGTSSSTYYAVISNYDLYSVYKDTIYALPVPEGYKISNIAIAADIYAAPISTKASYSSELSLHRMESAQSAPITAYTSEFTKVDALKYTTSLPVKMTSPAGVSEQNPYLVTYTTVTGSGVKVYVPTITVDFSYVVT